VAAVFLAVAVSVSVVMSTDRLPALRPAPVPVTTAQAQAVPRTMLCPRLAACCQIMMGVAMAYMLILML
jgi:hypothetical protein